MSRLIAQIMLSILLFPLAGLLYLVVYILYIESNRGSWTPYRNEMALLTAGATSWAFIACYWIALWRKSVRWTGERWGFTLMCFVAAAVVGGVIGGAINSVVREE